MKRIAIILFILLYTGCTFKITSYGIEQIEPNEELIGKSTPKPKVKKFPCEKKAKAKSLQFLEQQYRCNSHNRVGE